MSKTKNNTDDEGTPEAAALYIASMTDELARLAKHHGLDPLAFILEMARLEADEITRASRH